jgi:2-methylisocitrate lyase-like PEP mutase family enzyme
MRTQAEKAAAFRALHERPGAFIIPNPWDAGTAKLLASLGFEALATTSLGLSNSLGRPDGAGVVSREEVLDNCRLIAAATDLPVNADLENGYADEPRAAAEMIRLASEAGIVGGSIEDATGDPQNPIYDFALAVERVQAAVETGRSLPVPFVLTARAENLLHGRPDLDDTIRRLQAFEKAGADVLYAPGLRDIPPIRTAVRAVGKPLNVVMSARRPRHHPGPARRGGRQAHQRGARCRASPSPRSQGRARDEGCGRVHVGPRHRPHQGSEAVFAPAP